MDGNTRFFRVDHVFFVTLIDGFIFGDEPFSSVIFVLTTTKIGHYKSNVLMLCTRIAGSSQFDQKQMHNL